MTSPSAAKSSILKSDVSCEGCNLGPFSAPRWAQRASKQVLTNNLPRYQDSCLRLHALSVHARCPWRIRMCLALFPSHHSAALQALLMAQPEFWRAERHQKHVHGNHFSGSLRTLTSSWMAPFQNHPIFSGVQKKHDGVTRGCGSSQYRQKCNKKTSRCYYSTEDSHTKRAASSHQMHAGFMSAAQTLTELLIWLNLRASLPVSS